MIRAELLWQVKLVAPPRSDKTQRFDCIVCHYNKNGLDLACCCTPCNRFLCQPAGMYNTKNVVVVGSLLEGGER